MKKINMYMAAFGLVLVYAATVLFEGINHIYSIVSIPLFILGSIFLMGSLFYNPYDDDDLVT